MAKKSLTDALMLIIGAPKKGKHSCPECDSSMGSEGSCSECGYGESEDEGEMEDGGEEEMSSERLVEIRDDLQRVVDKISKLID